MPPKRKSEEPSGVEAGIKRLEEIADLLQRGELPLEQSLKLYEEGLELTKSCAEQLQRASLTVSRLEKDLAGTLKTIRESFDDE